MLGVDKIDRRVSGYLLHPHPAAFSSPFLFHSPRRAGKRVQSSDGKFSRVSASNQAWPGEKEFIYSSSPSGKH